MPYRQYIYNNADEARTAAATALEACRSTGEIPVLLTPSSAAVSWLRRTFSDDFVSWGVRVETLDAWVGDRWELFGDGRRIVASQERELLMQLACEQPEQGVDGVDGVWDCAPGTVALLSRLAQDALPRLVRISPAEADTAGLSEAEQRVLAVLRRYDALLKERSLCEVSQAAFELSRFLEKVPSLVLVGFDDIGCAYADMLAVLSERTNVSRFDDGCCASRIDSSRNPELQNLLSHLFKPVEADPVEPTGAVRFLFPAGRYAAPASIARCIIEAAQHKRSIVHTSAGACAALPVVVASRDPYALFDEVSEPLAKAGVYSAVSARRTFADTAFGRVFLALLSFVYDEHYRVSQASDFALSAFSGISRRVAGELDAAWRANRAITRAQIISDLASSSEVASDVFSAFASGGINGALMRLEKHLRGARELDAAFRAEQLAAVSVAHTFAALCVELGLPILAAQPLLARASVSAAARVELPADLDVSSGDGAVSHPSVLFMSLSQAAERPACSCSTLMVCDLTAAAYPLRSVEDGATMLMDKLGLGCVGDPLIEARRCFFRALSSARDAVVLERVLNTEEASEAYPAVMFEELVDCYRAPDTSFESIDRTTGLPIPLASYAQTAGEEDIQMNLAFDVQGLVCDREAAGHPDDHENPSFTSWDISPLGVVSQTMRSRIVLPRPDVAADSCGDKASSMPVLSPSALESYLECPYKWFALRRLRVSRPDAEFGPKEMGSFSHAVLKAFYERFQERGFLKVDEVNLPVAHEVLTEVFDERLSAQRNLKPKDNPLLARTKFEEAEVADLRRKLGNYLDREVLLLPGFVPTHFEFDFGTVTPFEYAGCLLRGSIDRVDVNDRGQAVVIDYKGSVSNDYAVHAATPVAQAGFEVLPHKVQTLMYAQVVQRLLGLNVVGAIYVSYSKPKISGAIDRGVLGEDSLPGLKIEACGMPAHDVSAFDGATFTELVDLVEERIARAVDMLLSGSISPNPRGEDPCGYCPVLACERRRGKE